MVIASKTPSHTFSHLLKVVIASKITGGANVNARNIEADLRGSLTRLSTDYLDLYLLHWPARYTPQSNWGQSLEYNAGVQQFTRARAPFEEDVLLSPSHTFSHLLIPSQGARPVRGGGDGNGLARLEGADPRLGDV